MISAAITDLLSFLAILVVTFDTSAEGVTVGLLMGYLVRIVLQILLILLLVKNNLSTTFICFYLFSNNT